MSSFMQSHNLSIKSLIKFLATFLIFAIYSCISKTYYSSL